MTFSKKLWMRAVSFVALRELIGLISEHPGGLRAKDIENLVRQERRLETKENRLPSRTTIYHYRNTLLHLGVLIRQKGCYLVNKKNPIVRALLAIISPGTSTLSSDERRLFSQLVIANEDCRHYFFNFFMPDRETYDLDEFISFGQRIAWKTYLSSQGRQVRLYNLDNDKVEYWLRTEDEFQAILYGIRYWARNELIILDEIFLEDKGGVMFPVRAEGTIPDLAISMALLKEVKDETLWTTLSVRDIAFKWGPRYRVPLKRIFGTLSAIRKAYQEYVVLIPTAEAFATITAESPGAEAYQLRSYLQEGGQYISHIRIHRKLKEVFQWGTLSRV
ncbi:hypothetical protein Desku_2483 [Desulfofundulus kuznetsovii DSM 6115]|uniref:WYL domain-containing protein n=1 Tax=Desulfofundulus kuznetsovii (strain DSM 6115 / VKM B-1805 / 17) TaxID=760568 RepID=A0AAU8PEQ5_DESK7|nr:hypothetical protein Desku_2483 [Desulfofundulus kuznetsovii DSM 6115]